MYWDKDYFEDWMNRILSLLLEIKKLQSKEEKETMVLMPDGTRLLDNQDLCKMLNVSKRTLQYFRSSGDLPYQRIRRKTYYLEADVLEFIDRNFGSFRRIKIQKP